MAVPIVEEFIELAEIDTVSRQERAMVDALKGKQLYSVWSEDGKLQWNDPELEIDFTDKAGS